MICLALMSEHILQYFEQAEKMPLIAHTNYYKNLQGYYPIRQSIQLSEEAKRNIDLISHYPK